jgi:acyl carrier protein
MSAINAQLGQDVMHSASSTVKLEPALRDPHALKAQVRQYVMDNLVMGTQELELGDDDSFMEQHLIDSFGVVELVTFVEKTFGIKVQDSEMVPDNLDSMNAVVRYLQHKLDGRT